MKFPKINTLYVREKGHLIWAGWIIALFLNNVSPFLLGLGEELVGRAGPCSERRQEPGRDKEI